MVSAQVHSFLRIPAGVLAEHEIARARQELVVQPRAMDGESEPAPIALYRNIPGGGIAVPIDWGLRRWPDMPIEDRTTAGRPLDVRRLPDPYHPKAGEGQAEFVEAIVAQGQERFSLLAKAGTGTGKTVSALSAAGQWGMSTIVFVHLDRLAKQWRDEAIQHLGLKPSEIGFIQGDLCQWDRPFVIAMLQTMNLRDLPPEARMAFGTSIFDEVHRLGARTFATSLAVFPTQIKLALSATPKRKDGAEVVFLHQFGAPAVHLEGEALFARAEAVPFRHVYPVPALKHGGMVRYLTRSAPRNRFLVSQIMRFVRRGRRAIIIGDSIKHLQALRRECIAQGMSERASGLYVGYTYTGRTRWKVAASSPAEAPREVKPGNFVLAKKPFPTKAACRVDQIAPGGIAVLLPVDGGAAFAAPLAYVQLAERVPETKTVREEEKDRVLRNASFIFTTYGMFKEGIDVPRLDAGIDVTPRSEAEQVIGRIRRRLADREKLTPWWITPRDIGCARAERYYTARKRELQKCNCEVVENAAG